MSLVAGVRWSFSGVRTEGAPIAALSKRLRTQHRGEQRGQTALLRFVKPSYLGRVGGRPLGAYEQEVALDDGLGHVVELATAALRL